MQNICYIDGQNLHISTTKSEDPWRINLKKLRIYLNRKYNVGEIYYFIGYYNEKNEVLYNKITEAGYTLKFKQHNELMFSKKKGNVDSDIIYEILTDIIDSKVEKILLISGNGDYYNLVKYLIEKDIFLKILFPNKKFASSLYKNLTARYFNCLEDIKDKLT